MGGKAERERERKRLIMISYLALLVIHFGSFLATVILFTLEANLANEKKSDKYREGRRERECCPPINVIHLLMLYNYHCCPPIDVIQLLMLSNY